MPCVFGTTAAAASAFPSTLPAITPPAISPGSVILFQGGSHHRRWTRQKPAGPQQRCGAGTRLSASTCRRAPFRSSKTWPQGFEPGISGNKIPDLEARWQADCIDLKPAVLSILIGVNDLWHKLNGKYDGTPEIYRDGFAALLQRTRAALPDTLLIICEPFVLRCGAVNDTWFPEFETRRAIAEQVAKEAKATWVPFQQKFNEAVANGTEPSYWAADGVHPTPAGHALMAKTWRDVMGI